MICLIANGRSGTNALYYNLFKMPKEYSTKEPWKNSKLHSDFSFKNKKRMCKELGMFHIKPKQHCKNGPKETIDLLLKHGVKDFIILKRKNILALLVSDAFLKKYTNDKNQVTITKEFFSYGVRCFYKFEDACLEYLREKKESNSDITYLELIYEDHIKNDVSVACNMIKKSFHCIPKNKYRLKAPKENELPSHARNNSIKDTRKLEEKLENIDDVRKFLGKKHLWMLN
tara:strand:- start:7825 stop:8511 length:687 start_codon:yes stop_codon:yes gene_type:complete